MGPYLVNQSEILNYQNNSFRETIFDFIEENSEVYRCYIPETTDLESYIERGRQDGIWGDSLELNVFAQIFEAELHIFHYDDQPLAIFRAQEDRLSVFVRKPFEVRNELLVKVLQMDSRLEALVRVREASRVGVVDLPLYSLMYTNGNHYDSIVPMSNDEYAEFHRGFAEQVIKNVFLIDLLIYRLIIYRFIHK